jgi:hypothetical protein
MDGRAREESPHTVMDIPRQQLLCETPFSPPKCRLFARGLHPIRTPIGYPSNLP